MLKVIIVFGLLLAAASPAIGQETKEIEPITDHVIVVREYSPAIQREDLDIVFGEYLPEEFGSDLIITP